MKIADIAQFVTSKNAGPFLLTVDIVFRDADSYKRFKTQRPLTKAGVAELYGLAPKDVLDIIETTPGGQQVSSRVGNIEYESATIRG